MLDATVVGPAAEIETTFNTDQAALANVFAGYFSLPSPELDRKSVV